MAITPPDQPDKSLPPQQGTVPAGSDAGTTSSLPASFLKKYGLYIVGALIAVAIIGLAVTHHL